ncbi:putative molybdenum transport ATP-binding protein [Phlyctochytrium arcticum]|nr:putative molybdenum transport ATP-binding protein [Phlyctochytrium arcticum]
MLTLQRKSPIRASWPVLTKSCRWKSYARRHSTRCDQIIVHNATVLRYGSHADTHEQVIFKDFSWAFQKGERWAIIGPVGSGRTSFCELLLGRHRVLPGTSLQYPFIERLKARDANKQEQSLWPQDLIKLVSFKEQSRSFSYGNHYYQQRYEFVEAWEDISLRQFLQQAMPSSKDSGEGGQDRVEQIASAVNLLPQLDLSFMKLSNGQVRRARIAKCLLGNPKVMLLDEPFMGLDEQNRDVVSLLLGGMAESENPHILLTLRPQEPIPKWITHVLDLDRSHTPRWQGSKEKRKSVNVLPSPNLPIRSKPLPESGAATGNSVVRLKKVTVQHGGVDLLKNVTWDIKEGERWALIGHNGSGKSTLLSLLVGDNPQAYSNDIQLFGQQRGTGETIWDIKAKVGLSSPEVHMYFKQPLSGFEVVATSFQDIPSFNIKLTEEQADRIKELLEAFQAEELATRRFSRLSTGEQRLILFLRAVAKIPKLLVLDEPFQGLDDDLVAMCRNWLDTNLTPDQTLIFVTHCLEELPSSVDRVLKLESGSVSAQHLI